VTFRLVVAHHVEQIGILVGTHLYHEGLLTLVRVVGEGYGLSFRGKSCVSFFLKEKMRGDGGRKGGIF
jgi:hypothetical protein